MVFQLKKRKRVGKASDAYRHDLFFTNHLEFPPSCIRRSKAIARVVSWVDQTVASLSYTDKDKEQLRCSRRDSEIWWWDTEV